MGSFQEFPKMLYRAAEQRIVSDIDEEAAASKEGFGPLGSGADDSEEAPAKRSAKKTKE